MFLEFSGNGLDFAGFGIKQALQALWGPNQWQFGSVQPLHRVFRMCLQKGTSCRNFGIELVDSQNYEVSFFQTWSKTCFGIYEMWLKTYFGIYGVLCFWIKFIPRGHPWVLNLFWAWGHDIFAPFILCCVKLFREGCSGVDPIFGSKKTFRAFWRTDKILLRFFAMKWKGKTFLEKLIAFLRIQSLVETRWGEKPMKTSWELGEYLVKPSGNLVQIWWNLRGIWRRPCEHSKAGEQTRWNSEIWWKPCEIYLLKKRLHFEISPKEALSHVVLVKCWSVWR